MYLGVKVNLFRLRAIRQGTLLVAEVARQQRYINIAERLRFLVGAPGPERGHFLYIVLGERVLMIRND